MFGTGSHQNDVERGIEGESRMFSFSSMQCGQRSPKMPEVSVGHWASTQPQDDEHFETGTYLVLSRVEN